MPERGEIYEGGRTDIHIFVQTSASAHFQSERGMHEVDLRWRENAANGSRLAGAVEDLAYFNFMTI